MASVELPSTLPSPSHRVHGVVIDDDAAQVPAKYIVQGAIVGLVDSSPVAQVPVIDLSLLCSSSSGKDTEIELEKLKSALSDWGCFQLIGHGVSVSFLEKLRSITKEFFALPLGEKEKYARAADDIEGYGTDPVLSDKQVLDWSNRLFLNLLPLESRKLKLWPDSPGEFREVLDEYCNQVKLIIEILLKAMSKSLNLEENCFSSKYGDQALMAARFNHYPPCSRPDLVLGAKAHSDGSGITVLLQDQDVEGLQMLKDGQWFRVPVVPDAFLAHAGDQMQIMSNGIFKSPLHRVTTNSRSERLSVAVFYLPDIETEIEPEVGLITAEWPQMYRKLKNYAAINFECFQSGQIALDTVRL